jgi:oxygen-dependent protoporphyrinogen oxidase
MKPSGEAATPVVVVGAGIAGLTAAYELHKAGVATVVVERLPYAGGRMSSETVDGHVIDRGAYTLSGYSTRTLALADELGVKDQYTHITPWAGLYYRRRVHRYRGDSPLGMAWGAGFGPTDALAALAVLRESKRQTPHLRLHRPDEHTFCLEEETAAAYALRMGGDKLLERVAYPMISTLYLSDPEHISKAAFLASMRYTLGLRLLNSAHGIGLLCDTLAGILNVQLATEVLACHRKGSGVEVVIRGRQGEEAVTAQALISTAVAPVAVRLLGGMLEEEAREALGEVAYVPSVPVAIGLDAQVVRGKQFIVNLPRTKRFTHLSAVTTEPNKHPGRVPEGKGLLMALPTREASGEFIELDDGEVVRAVLEDVERLYPRVSGHVAFTRVYRWEHGCSQLRPGDLRGRARLRAALPRSGPVFLAGDYLVSSSSIEGSLVSGQQAAKAVLEFLPRV